MLITSFASVMANTDTNRFFPGLALFLCITGLSLPGFAQTVSAGASKEFSIPTTGRKPVIDGDIAADEWSDALRLADLHQVVPVEFSQPSERTVFYFKYDEDALYVAAYAYDSRPGEITAYALRQGGSIEGDDYVSVLLDTFNNNRSGYDFQVNPNGVREEAIYTNAVDRTDDWEGIWTGAAMRTSDGWTAEFEIPFKSVAFDVNDDTWGVNVWRKIARKNETIAWQSQNGSVDPTVSGEMTGLHNLRQGIGLDLVPSAVARTIRNHESGESDSKLEPSLDATYKLTPSLNLSLTLNTDFSATEVDDVQLDLGRFGLFFPEKRSFFLTDFDIFNFGNIPTVRRWGLPANNNGIPFFSRRVGLAPDGSAVDLNAGLKLSGRVGRFDVGTLIVNQDAYSYTDRSGNPVSVDAGTLYVARVVTPVLEESSVGAIATYGDPSSDLDAQTLGLDFSYRNTRLPGNRSMAANIWAQQTDNELTSDQNRAWNLSIDLPSRRSWFGSARYHRAEENFDPRLGFANRTGIDLFAFEGGTQHVFDSGGWLQRWEGEFAYSRFDFLDTGELQSSEVSITPFKFTSHADDFFRLALARVREGLRAGEQPLGRLGIMLDPGEYEFDRVDIDIRSSDARDWYLGLRLEAGDYYDGELLVVGPEIAWKFGSRVYLQLGVETNRYKFDDAEATARIVEFRNEVNFSASKSLITLVQYDNLSDQLGVNSRFRWNFDPGKDLWLVLNHNMLEDQGDGRNGFTNVESSIAVKFRYTFRY